MIQSVLLSTVAKFLQPVTMTALIELTVLLEYFIFPILFTNYSGIILYAFNYSQNYSGIIDESLSIWVSAVFYIL